MSFPTADSTYVYEPPADQCLRCFAAGETPHITFVCLSGIRIGALWNPGDPVPPNGTWPLSPINPCLWHTVNAPYWFTYQDTPIQNLLQVTDALANAYFLSVGPPGCDFWHSNFWAVPAGNKYYGGYALLQHAMPTDPWSIQEVMDDLGLTPAADLYVTPRAVAAEQAVHTFSDRQSSTNIKILYDHS